MFSSRPRNAFDMAGVDIALLHASCIPARYAVGTIEVDADGLANWADGFDDVRPAVDRGADTWIALEPRFKQYDFKVGSMALRSPAPTPSRPPSVS